MKTVHVDLGPRSYDVLIGRGLLDRAGELLKERGLQGSAAIISDETVSPLYAQRAGSSLSASGFQSFLAEVPAGEPSKSMAEMARLLSELAQKRVPRSGTVVGLGGGVVGDLAGFVAASYQRGINFVQIPTTLLAMVDSSVGGKTGVNLPEGKNLVGAFYQPKLVIIDLDVLKTLPAREFAAGMAEVIKYGAIADVALFKQVAEGISRDDDSLEEIIKKCIQIKASIVKEDEFETTGKRALLNFGHTIGHAIEAESEYKEYLHGEAIALGMRAAAWLSVKLGKLTEADVYALENAMEANGLKVQAKEKYGNGKGAFFNSAQVFSFLGRDKKIKDGIFQFVLLDKIGQAKSGCATPSDKNLLIQSVIQHLEQPLGKKFTGNF